MDCYTCFSSSFNLHFYSVRHTRSLETVTETLPLHTPFLQHLCFSLLSVVIVLDQFILASSFGRHTTLIICIRFLLSPKKIIRLFACNIFFRITIFLFGNIDNVQSQQDNFARKWSHKSFEEKNMKQTRKRRGERAQGIKHFWQSPVLNNM